MKKLFTSLILLMALSIFGSGQAWAELKINGVVISESSNKTLTSSESFIGRGQIVWKAADKTLTFDNCYLRADEGKDAVYNNSVEGLKIYFKGDNQISSDNTTSTYGCIYSTKDIALHSSSGSSRGYVAITSNGGRCIWVSEGAKLTITDLYVSATSINSTAIYASKPSVMSLGSASIYAAGGTGNYAISGFTGGIANYNNTGGFPTCLPSNTSYSFNASKGGVVNSSGTLVSSVFIAPSLMIGNRGVWTANPAETSYTSSFEGSGISSGTVKFNPSTKTLTLDNATINAGIINYGIPDLKIETTGTSSVTSSSTHAISLYKSTSLTGSGTLNAKSTNASSSGLSLVFSDVTVQMRKLQVEGGYCGIIGSGKLKLNFYSSSSNPGDYYFLGGTYNVHVSDIVLGTNMDIYTKNTWLKGGDAYYKTAIANKSNGEAVGTNFYGYASGFSTYDVYVAGTQLNSRNKGGFYNEYVKGGEITYDSGTHTLSLNNVTISDMPSGKNAIKNSGIDGLTIKTTGSNSLTSQDACIAVYKNTTFTGSGILTATATNGSGLCVYGSSSVAVTLKNTDGADIVFKGSNYGFFGEGGSPLNIVKDGTGGDYYFYGDAGHIHQVALNLGTGAEIYNPYTWYNESAKEVYYKDERAKGSNLSNSGYGVNIDASRSYVYYDIYIGGTRLNDCNSSGFWNKYVKGGSISYDNSSKVLKFSNASVDVGSDAVPALKASVAGLTIGLAGESTIAGCNSSIYVINLSNNVTIGNATTTSTGTLNVPDDHIRVASGALTIDKCNVNAKYITSASGSLAINGATVKVANNISGFASLSKTNADFAVPQGGTYSTSSKRVEYNGSTWSAGIVIQPLTKYKVYVAGVQVNSYNKDDIFADPVYAYGTSGTAIYDPSSKTLTMSGVDISAPEDKNKDGVQVDEEGVTLQFFGTNNIKASGSSASAIYGTNSSSGLTILGAGPSPKLTVSNTSTGYPALLTYANSTIRNIAVKTNAIWGYVSNTNTLTVDAATVACDGWLGRNTLNRFADVVLDGGVKVMKPAGAEYSTSLHALALGGSAVTSEVLLDMGDEYPIDIAGVPLNSLNASAFTDSHLTSGSVTYDAVNKILYLTDATINMGGENKNAIRNQQSGLVINVTGNCRLVGTSSNWSPLYTRGDITITGSGTLTVDNPNIDGAICTSNGADVTITETNVNILGSLNADNSGSYLTITDSNVTIDSKSQNAINGFEDLILDRCDIISPSGADYSTSDHALYLGGSKYKGVVSIEPVTLYNISINGVEVHDKNAADIKCPNMTSGSVSVNVSGAFPIIEFNNVHIDGETQDPVVYVGSAAGNVVVRLLGDNVINVTNPHTAVITYYGSDTQNYTITGTGSLTSNSQYTIFGPGKPSLTISDVTLNAGSIYSFSNVEFNNAALTLHGDNTDGTLENIDNLMLTNCDYTDESLHFNSSLKAVTQDDVNPYKGDINIIPMKKYGLTIASVVVSDLNADDILGDGSVRWDATAGRLTLNNANIDGSPADAILVDGTQLSNMQIDLVGTNRVSGQYALRVVGGSCNVTVSSSDGTGRVSFVGSDNAVDNVDRLTVANAMVGITGNNIGMRGGSLEVQKGGVVGVLAQNGTNAFVDNVSIDLAANFVALEPTTSTIVAASDITSQKAVAFGEDYGFSVAGQRVTSYLMTTTGYSVYDPSTKTLTMDNVSGAGYLNNEKCDGLTLKVSGTNNITSGSESAITTLVPMTIDGTGSFTLVSTGVAAINAQADITITGGVTVSLAGKNAYDGNGTSTLHINNSTLVANGTDDVFVGLAGLDMTDVDIVSPTAEGGAVAEFADGTVKLNGETVKGEAVLIESGTPVIPTGVTIAGVDITSGNAGDVTAPGITAGTVSYDESSKTLTLNGATITGQGIKATSDLVIRLIGNNSIADVATAIEAEAGLRIYSEFETGTLNIAATTAAISAAADINIDKCLVIADGGEKGIVGSAASSVLSIDNAAVRAKGTVASVSGITSQNLTGGVEMSTSGATFNDATMQVEIEELVATDWIDYSEFYGFYVGKTAVTRALIYDETGEVAPGVSFNRTTRALILTNATIDGIWQVDDQPLDIVFEGENTVKCSTHGSGINAPAFRVGGTVNIVPALVGATITFDGGDMNTAIQLAANARLAILNEAAVVIKGLKGVVGDGSGSLSITNSTVMVNATAQGITGLAALNMSGVGIFVPQNAAFNSATGAVELNGAAVMGQQIIINAEGDAINSVAADGADIDAIYAVDGKKLGRAQNGVNIVRMTDGSIRKVLRK